MLSFRRAETIRAALKFWAEEMAPHDSDAQRPYYDDPDVEPLDAEEIEALRRQFLPDRVRFVKVDETGYVLTPLILFRPSEEFLDARRIAVLLLPPQE